MNNASHDQHFFDTFILVLGILIAVAFGLYFGARYIAAQTQEAAVQEDPLVQQATAERIRPVGQLVLAETTDTAGAALNIPVAATTAPAAAQAPSGEDIFNSACALCHGTGIAGAPKVGDKAAWSARIAQGKTTLYEHALKGFTGKTGVMPMKGGRADLSDQAIKDTVDYMVEKSQ